MGKKIVAFFIVFLATFLFGVDLVSAQTVSCFSGTGPLLTISGNQTSRFDRRSNPLAAGTRVDARTAVWTQVDDWPVNFPGGPGMCWLGGKIQGLYPPSTTWDVMHSTGAFSIHAESATVERIRIDDYGDAIRILEKAKNFVIRDVHISYNRDDCVENDWLWSGLIDDSLFDGCYTAFSARTYSSQSGVRNGSQDVWTIKNSLIRLQPMEKVYKDRGLIPGHGQFFKWDSSGISPKLSLHNNIFRADQPGNDSGNLQLPPGKLADCSNNTLVWLGTAKHGSFPSASTYPTTFNGKPCFTITTDKSVWDNAVAAWQARHGGPSVTPIISPAVSITSVKSPTPGPTTPGCAKKPQGDADCNGRIEILDFEIWRKEFLKEATTKTADFNSDNQVNILDFELWRRGIFLL